LLGVAAVAATVLGLAWFGSFVAGMDSTTVARAQVVGTTLATVAATVLVLLTAAYVWATRQMVLEMERSRLDDVAGRAGDAATKARGHLRAALLEQTENCRTLLGSDPSVGSAAAATTATWQPSFIDLQAWMRETDLPDDLTAYLAWLIGAARHFHGLFRDECRLASVAMGSLIVPLGQTEAWDRWSAELEETQVIAELLVAWAVLDPALGPVPAQFDEHPWILPRRRPDGWRASLGLQPFELVVPPSFPAGGAFELASAASRQGRQVD
jgi:hypothetical protein